jgi:hypothetical protein
MNEMAKQEIQAAASLNPACPTRVPRTAQARLLLHDPNVDTPFMEVLSQTLPDEAARLAYLNHLGWQART